MYLLIEKSTNIVRDIQAETFEVTADFEWVQDKSVTDRSNANRTTYDKQSKEFTELPIPIQRPSELSNVMIAEKLAELDAKIGDKEPVLGIGEVNHNQNYLVYLAILPLLLIAYLFGRYKKENKLV